MSYLSVSCYHIGKRNNKKCRQYKKNENMKNKNQLKIKWLVNKNGNSNWEKVKKKKPPAKYFPLAIGTWYTDKHSCKM